MRRLGVIAWVAITVAALVATPLSVSVKTVATPAPTVAISVVSTEAMAMPCDPSHGLHPGLALMCYLMWLMELGDVGD